MCLHTHSFRNPDSQKATNLVLPFFKCTPKKTRKITVEKTKHTCTRVYVLAYACIQTSTIKIKQTLQVLLLKHNFLCKLNYSIM